MTQRLAAVVGQLSDEAATARAEREIQWKRLAQLQAELDTIKKAWAKIAGLEEPDA